MVDSPKEKAMTDGLESLPARVETVERKLDQFIDTQSKTNELAERRLRLWAPPDSGPADKDKK